MTRFSPKYVHDFNVILEDPEVDIVVEAMGRQRNRLMNL